MDSPRSRLWCSKATFPAKSSGDMSHSDLWNNRPFKNRSFSLVPSPWGRWVFCLPPQRKEGAEECGFFLFSCRNKLFAVPNYKDIGMAQAYAPHLNRWMPAPWTKQMDSYLPYVTSDWESIEKILVRGNNICFIVGNRPRNWSWLSQYDMDKDYLVVSTKWF